MTWVHAAIPFFKALHILALVAWLGGLFALPMMLVRHDPHTSLRQYRLVRRATHLTYTLLATPAAVIAVIAGTWLVFMREVFTPWLYAKLVFVALLVLAHAWIGHILTRIGEEPTDYRPPPAALPFALLLPLTLAILFLVLAKPSLEVSFPRWLATPRDGQLLFDVPSP